ncbi:MAG: BON domain-containing protein [Vampirovibrionales bacterium]
MLKLSTAACAMALLAWGVAAAVTPAAWANPNAPWDGTELALIDAVEERVQDSATETRIKVRIADEDLMDNTDLEVDVDDGVAIIKGAVNTDAQRRKALDIARNTKHVVRVVDQIVVTGARQQYDKRDSNYLERFGHGLDDGQLANRIRLKLRTEGLSNAGDIDVKVNDNVAVLTGHVEKTEDAQRAGQVARSFKHVRNVINRIEVRPIYDH